METIKSKIKDIIQDKKIYIFSLITVLFFGMFCILQYAPDTYSVFTNGVKNTVLHFISCGRYVTGFSFAFVTKILNLTNNGIYYLSYVFAIICTVISLYKLSKLLQDIIKNDILNYIVTTLIIINPFSIELFMYIEKGIMMFSILACIFAIEQVNKFFKGNKKSLIFAIIWMLIAVCSYQGTIGIFVAISLIYILKYSKNIKEFIKNNIIVACIYGIPSLINLLLVRFLGANSRVTGEMILSESIHKILDGTTNMIINTYSILPKYIFLIAILILFAIIIYKGIRNSEDNCKRKILKILGALYILSGTFLVTIAPQILQDTNAIWFVARSSYPMGAIVGLLIVYLCMNFKLKPIQNYIIIFMIIVFGIIQFVSFVNMEIDNYIGNYMDKELTLKIEEQIEEYEENTGKKIDSISIYYDKATKYSYDEVKASGDMNIRAYSANWCVTRIIELYTGRDLKEEENSDKIKEEFKEKNWDNFDKEQIIFEENIMHLCVF